MNREILFRGFNEDPNGNEEIELDGRIIKGKWLYGYYSDEKGIGTDFPSIEVFKNSEPNPISWKVISETVSQYAGLDDKNGKKIFENDVVRFNANRYYHTMTYPVEYRSSIGKFVISAGYKYFGLKNKNVEVIGTIFGKKEVSDE